MCAIESFLPQWNAIECVEGDENGTLSGMVVVLLMVMVVEVVNGELRWWW